MAIKADYETKPISTELWGRMKALRREHWGHTFTAQAEGGICATGFAWQFQPLLAAFGTFGNPSMGTNFARAAREGTGPNGLRKYIDIATSKGLTPMCGAIGAHIGQVYEGVSFVGPKGQKITPDFVFQPMGCHAIYKGAQICSGLLGLPMLMIDMPTICSDSSREYVLAQLLDSIEWIEKQTKKKFDDEKFVEAVRNATSARVLWSKTSSLMKNIPSPITVRQAMSLNQPLVAYPYSKGTVEYCEALYVEVQERIEKGIAGAPFERKRLMSVGIHPLYRPDVLRWPEQYGAVFVTGGPAYGAWIQTEDGHVVPGKTIEERGLELKTREDALRAMIYLNLPPETPRKMSRNSFVMIRHVQDWHVDGVMIHMPRRCPASQGTFGVFDLKADLLAAGIPVGTYEASEADPNEFDEVRVREDFERFLESLGLTKLSGLKDSQPTEEDK
jgi:benzoyl-CoA reductase/2-hydroxyglutaryl-CoA dehydratase subunit BcrC/BadD/HgdB